MTLTYNLDMVIIRGPDIWAKGTVVWTSGDDRSYLYLISSESDAHEPIPTNRQRDVIIIMAPPLCFFMCTLEQ